MSTPSHFDDDRPGYTGPDYTWDPTTTADLHDTDYDTGAYQPGPIPPNIYY
jgi:hypothetical protein